MEKFWLLGRSCLGGCLQLQISNGLFSKARLNHPSKPLDKFNQPVREVTWPQSIASPCIPIICPMPNHDAKDHLTSNSLPPNNMITKEGCLKSQQARPTNIKPNRWCLPGIQTISPPPLTPSPPISLSPPPN